MELPMTLADSLRRIAGSNRSEAWDKCPERREASQDCSQAIPQPFHRRRRTLGDRLFGRLTRRCGVAKTNRIASPAMSHTGHSCHQSHDRSLHGADTVSSRGGHSVPASSSPADQPQAR